MTNKWNFGSLIQDDHTQMVITQSFYLKCDVVEEVEIFKTHRVKHNVVFNVSQYYVILI